MIFISADTIPSHRSKLLVLDLTPASSSILIGDILLYTLCVTNTSSSVLENICIKLPLSDGICILPQSLNINGCILSDQQLQLGIPIEFLAPYESSTITFTLGVSDVLDIPFVTHAIATYKYLDPLYHYLKVQVVYSNDITLSTVCIDFEVALVADKKSVTLNDVIHYTLHLTNKGNYTLNTLTYIPNFTHTSYLIPESIRLDDCPLDIAPTKGISLPPLLPHQHYTFSYDVCIIGSTCSYYLEDSAKLILYTPLFEEERSLTMPQIKVNIHSFQVVQLERVLSLQKCYVGIGEIDSISCEIHIDDDYIIPSIPSLSSERRVLTHYQAIVCGCFYLSIEYTPANGDPAIYSTYFKLPFSTFIVLPATYTNEPLHFIASMEYSDTHLISPYHFSFLSSFTIHAKCMC